ARSSCPPGSAAAPSGTRRTRSRAPPAPRAPAPTRVARAAPPRARARAAPRTLVLQRGSHPRPAVEARRRPLQPHRSLRMRGEVPLPHRLGLEVLAVARGEEVARLLDGGGDHVGVLRQ